MPISLEQFARGLSACGLMSAEGLAAFRSALPAEPSGDVENLAQELVRQGKLTPYQAAELQAGRAAGLLLGDYVVLEKIGEGGMGQVFKARQKRMNRLVAVKVLPGSANESPASVERFKREVRLVARLSHPNIVAAYDADVQAGGTRYLVMEFVDGSDLSTLVKRNGPFPIEQAVDCLMQAARGLEHAHREGIIHRDIKPANLLLDQEGTVKILDMGLARIDSDQPSSTGLHQQLTNSGLIMGTIDYMSPEQAEDPRQADGRADIYSLGATLYLLLTGKRMYERETLMQKLLAHRSSAIPSLTDLRGDVPELLESIYQRMVAKEPNDRFQSMTEVSRALERCLIQLQGKPSHAPRERSSGIGFQPVEASVRPMTGWKPSPLNSEPSPLPFTSTSATANDSQPPLSVTSQSARVRRMAAPSRWRTRPVVLTVAAAGLLLAALAWWGKPDRPASVQSKPAAARPGNKPPSKPAVPTQQPAATLSPEVAVRVDAQGHVELPFWEYKGDTPLTVECWVRPDETGPEQFVLSNQEQSGMGIRVRTGKWQFDLFLGGGHQSILSDQLAVPLQATHVAGVFDGKQMRLYVDGRQQSQTLTPPGAHKPGVFPIVIGANPMPTSPPGETYGVTQLFSGIVDELRLSSSVRYTADFTPQRRFEPDDQTLALYHFDEGRGQQASDASAHQRPARLRGARWTRMTYLD